MSDSQQATEISSPVPADHRHILRRAQEGDETVRSQVREIVRRQGPAGLMPLGTVARKAVLKSMCEKDIALEEDLIHQTAGLRRQLSGGTPTALESLLVERIVLCWLQLHGYEISYAQNEHRLTPEQTEVRQRRLTAAHHRYLSSIKALAQVRRLQRPALQVNMANQQINLAEHQVNLPRAGAEIGEGSVDG